jgi:hypothetical protein
VSRDRVLVDEEHVNRRVRRLSLRSYLADPCLRKVMCTASFTPFRNITARIL